MLRTTVFPLLLLAAGIAPPTYAAPMQPPAIVPEFPPELPDAAADGAATDLGPTLNAPIPADQAPTLTAPAAAPLATSLGPHGGTLVSRGNGEYIEVLYDHRTHAVTIFLPPSQGVSGVVPEHGLHHSESESASYFDCPLAASPPCPFDFGAYECEYERAHQGAQRNYPGEYAPRLDPTWTY